MVEIIAFIVLSSLITTFVAFVMTVIFGMHRDAVIDNRKRVKTAIQMYIVYNRTNDKPILVDYSDMEDFDDTLERITDWGCSHILPKDKYDLVKMYIDF